LKKETGSTIAGVRLPAAQRADTVGAPANHGGRRAMQGDKRSVAVKTEARQKLLWMAIGAGAMGALAVGTMAIGSIAIGALGIGRARIAKLRVDELEVGRIKIETREES
jgi:hypothetical protein